MNKYLKIILSEMCRRVGADFNKINFKRKDWFNKYSWTEAEENDFANWMISYLKKNKKAREELAGFSGWYLPTIKRTVLWFLLDYGWTNKKRKVRKNAKNGMC